MLLRAVEQLSYPLVISTVCYWTWLMKSWFTYSKGWFSIVNGHWNRGFSHGKMVISQFAFCMTRPGIVNGWDPMACHSPSVEDRGNQAISEPTRVLGTTRGEPNPVDDRSCLTATVKIHTRRRVNVGLSSWIK